MATLRRIHVILNDICERLETASKFFVYFSLDLNETTDIVDTSQLAVFIGGVNRKMKVTEKFLDVVSLKGRTTGKDIKEGVIKYLKDYQLDLKILLALQHMDPHR